MKIFMAVAVLSACSGPDTQSVPVIEPDFEVRRNLESLVPTFDGLLVDPSQCSFGIDGNLYVLDTGIDQILVINDSLQVVEVYAGPGSGPGELQPGLKLMAVSENRIVVSNWPNIHLFDQNGVFLSRFTVNDRMKDLDIGPDGEIIATIRDEEIQFVAWDQMGNELYRRGKPFIALPETRETVLLLSRANATCLSVLTDGAIAVFGPTWSRVRFYRGDSYSEQLIDLSPLPTEEQYRDEYTQIMKDHRRYSLERAEVKAARGTLRREDLPHWGPPSAPYVCADDGDSIWIANSGILCRLTREGIIDLICVGGWEMPGWIRDFAVSGEKVAYCFGDDYRGDGIAVGELRF